MKTTSYALRVRRYDPGVDRLEAAPMPGGAVAAPAEPRWSEYEVDATPGMTVLEALLRIQAEQDGTLAFRYSCRGAVCGSCAMTIDGEVGLACRTQLSSLETETVTIEPLPNLSVISDLVVDMDAFLSKEESVMPWLVPEEPAPARERIVLPEDWGEAEPYTNCILCASCHGVCPAAERDPGYLGPAALAKHYRFLADPRDVADAGRLALVDSEQGVFGCDVVWRCVRVCPKGVPPTKGIQKSRELIEDTDSEDTGREDRGSEDTGSEDTGREDRVSEDR